MTVQTTASPREGKSTREVVIEVARAQGITVREQPFSKTEMLQLDELFISGTTTDVTPVVEVDGQAIGGGKPGPVSLALYSGLQQRLYSGSAVAHR